MLARWSLRSKLVVLAALALLPVLGLAAWQARTEQRAVASQGRSALKIAADLAVARYGDLIEASTHLLSAACLNDAVQLTASLAPPPADVGRCDTYLSRLLAAFPERYSSILVTDEQGVARCASTPTAVGMSFADRDVFQKVRGASGLAVGNKISSRIGPHTVVPIALPIVRDGGFRGMCVLGITLKALADATGAPTESRGDIAVAVVDRAGVSVGGDAAAMRRLPAAARMAAAIAGRQDDFSEYGQDGTLYAFRLQPVDGSALFAVASAPLPEGPLVLAGAWAGFALVVLATLVVLLVIWLGADRWCVRPLRYIQDFADKVARGENIKLAPARPWTPEMASVGAGVTAMAEAIASREAALRAGLEQRDHMLREIHHRVKNNLQTVAALLRLQSRRTSSEEARLALGESVRRVSSIAMVHEALSISVDERVDLDKLLDNVLPMVGEVATAESQVGLSRKGSFGVVVAEIATPLVMVLAELVQNAIEHAFPDGRPGKVELVVERSARRLDVVIRDNGRGLPSGFSLERSDGLGLQIVRTLVESELRGSLSLRGLRGEGEESVGRRAGTEAALRIPLSRRL